MFPTNMLQTFLFTAKQTVLILLRQLLTGTKTCPHPYGGLSDAGKTAAYSAHVAAARQHSSSRVTRDTPTSKEQQQTRSD
jgi:hypothetical protein